MCKMCNYDSFCDEEDARIEVQWFAKKMEEKLKANDHKGGWKNCDIHWLYDRMLNEIIELDLEMGFGEIDAEKVVKECADIANFAMMIADIASKSSIN